MNRGGCWNRLKIFAGLVAAVCVVVLAVLVGNRLGDEALALLAGMVCSAGVMIPTSLLIIGMSQQRRDVGRVWPSALRNPHRGPSPIIIVVIRPLDGQQRAGGGIERLEGVTARLEGGLW